MQKLKKYLTRPVCLVLALTLLGGAVAVASLNGSPYDLLKNAAFTLLEQENFTMSLSMKAYVNGELVSSETENNAVGNGKTLDWNEYEDYMFYSYAAAVGSGTVHVGYNTDPSSDGTAPIYTAYYYPNNTTATGTLMSRMFGEEMTRSNTYARLAEALLDTMVGDLKNHMSSSTDSSGHRTVSGALTEGQVPELYNLLLSYAMTESTGRYGSSSSQVSPWVYGGATERTYTNTWFNGHEKTITTYRETVVEWYSEYYDEESNQWFYYKETDPGFDPSMAYPKTTHEIVSETRTAATAEDYGDLINQPVQSAYVDYVSGRVTLDKQNRPTGGSGILRIRALTLFGEEYEAEIVIDFTVSDYGTTDPSLPIENFDDIFTAELFESFYPSFNGYSSALYFSTDENGRVIPDSITDVYPKDDGAYTKDTPSAIAVDLLG